MPYNITVKIRNQELTEKEIIKKIDDFQQVFVNVASRYYSDIKNNKPNIF